MKLYYSPGACSLADHIALREAGAAFEIERVDLKTKLTATGTDFRSINPKGYVPVLVLDDGEVLSENAAVLDWIAARFPALGVDGALGRTRVLEALVFISTEVHNGFEPFFHDGSEAERARARAAIAELFRLLAKQKRGDFLFGNELSVADCYLFITLRWARKFDVPVPTTLLALHERMEARPSVRAALEAETVAA